MEYLRRRASVDIIVIQKRLNHIPVVRNMCEHTQLNLGIVGIHKHPTFPCDKKAAQFAAKVGAHRDILQIRLSRADTAGTRFSLVKIRMDASVRRDHL